MHIFIVLCFSIGHPVHFIAYRTYYALYCYAVIKFKAPAGTYTIEHNAKGLKLFCDVMKFSKATF